MLGSIVASFALTAALLGSPADQPARDFEARGVDADAVETGLRARVGDVLEDWTIDVRFEGSRRYVLTLRGPRDDADDVRSVRLEGRTKVDRSRELASMIATIIESRTPVYPRGFLALEAHLAAGSDLDLGLGLGGGVWLLRDHLQPRMRVAWSHGWAPSLRVNQLDVGVGLAAGAPVDSSGNLWLGGLVMPTLTWTHASNHAEGIGTASTWSGGSELCVLVQYRLPRFVVGVRTGIETTFPAVRVVAGTDELRFGPVRWLLAIELGLGFLD